MDNTHQNSTPVLYPLWHSTTISKHSCCSCRIDMKLLPDHGGAGVDVRVVTQSDTMKTFKNASNFLKSEVPIQDFSSKNCVLPLVNPNSLESLLDPCCEHLRHQQNKQKNYSSSMFHIAHGCSKDKKKRYLNLKTELSSKHKNRDEFIVPKRLVEISESMPDTFPVPRANWLYSGGCLESIAFNGINDNMPFLLHSGGTQLNDIVITSLTKNLLSEGKPIASTKWKFKLGGSPIYQISMQSFDRTVMGCIRQKQNYHIISGQLDDIHDENIFKMQGEKILYCSVSPYIMGEYVVLTQSGHLILKNKDTDCSTWNPLQEIQDLKIEDTWQGCDFGSHPRCISYCNCRTLSLVDLRIKNNKCLEIFNISSPFLFPKEELMLSKLNTARPYQHFVGTNHHMVLCDERFSQQPLSVWNHLLDSYPMYCNILQSSEIDNVPKTQVLLGTHLPQQVAYFSLMSSSYPQIQPVSCTPPCHLSVPMDIAEYLKLRCITLEEPTMKRLSTPIIGACSAVHTQGFLFFQLTSLGDLFYQKYFKSDKVDEKTHSIGPGCSFTSPFNISDVDWWIEEAKLTSNNISSSSSLEPLMQINCSKKFDSMHILPTPSINCSFCCKNASGNAPVENCMSCGMHSSDGKYIFQAAKLNTVISKVASHALDGNEYPALIKKEFCYKNMDPLSKSIYDTWFEGNMPTELANQFVEQNGTYDEITEIKPNMFPSAKTSNNSICDTVILEKGITETFDEIDDEIPPSQEMSQVLGETIRLSSAKNKRRSLRVADGF